MSDLSMALYEAARIAEELEKAGNWIDCGNSSDVRRDKIAVSITWHYGSAIPGYEPLRREIAEIVTEEFGALLEKAMEALQKKSDAAKERVESLWGTA